MLNSLLDSKIFPLFENNGWEVKMHDMLLRIRFAILCCTLSLFAVACRDGTQTTIDLGTLDGRTYTNQYFGFKLTTPENWTALDRESIKALDERGARLLAGDDKNLRALIEAGERTDVTLIMMNEHPLGTPVAFNPAFFCAAEKVSHLPGIRSGRDYLLGVKMLLESGQIDLNFTEGIKSVELGGVKFDLLVAQLNLGPGTRTEEFYAAIQKGYALTFGIVYDNDVQPTKLRECIESIRFTKTNLREESAENSESRRNKFRYFLDSADSLLKIYQSVIFLVVPVVLVGLLVFYWRSGK